MATINLLLGIVSILFALAVALRALELAVEGIRDASRLRRWNFVIAVVLGSVAWSFLTSVGQDFARASDSMLRSHPADATGFTAVLFWTLFSAIILVLDVNYVRGLRRSPAARARA